MSMKQTIKCIALFLILTAVSLGIVAIGAQTITGSQSDVVIQPETVKIESDADRYHHQLLASKYALDEQKINNLVMQFLNGNEEAKRLQADMKELNDEMSSLLDKMYKDHKLKQEDYEIKGDPPQFMRRAKK